MNKLLGKNSILLRTFFCFVSKRGKKSTGCDFHFTPPSFFLSAHLRDILLQFYTFYFLPFLKRINRKVKSQLYGIEVVQHKCRDKWRELGDKVLSRSLKSSTFAPELESDTSTMHGRAGWSRNGGENERKMKGDIMKVNLIIPIDSLRGMLRRDGYYFRMYRGSQIVQRCPNRSGHVKTEAEQANQTRFIERYGKKNRH